MPVITPYIILLLLCPLFGWFSWYEWKRPKKKRRMARLAALWLIFAGFMTLLFPPQVREVKPRGGQGVLITDGADKKILREFFDSLPAGTPAYSYWQYRYEQPRNIDTLHVFGYGLPADDWRSLAAPVIRWHAPASPAGITYADWERQLRLGDRLQLYGHYHNNRNKPVMLKLVWQGIVQDSMAVPAGADTGFHVSAGTYYAGAHSYYLEAVSEDSLLAREPVPVQVLPAEKLRILLLADAPGFETSFLVNWLAKEGYPLAVRYQLSRLQFSQSFMNMEPFPLGQPGRTQLDKFDLLITDPLSFAAAGAAFQRTVKEQVEQGGLGILFQADSSLGAPSWHNRGIRLSLPVSAQGGRYRTITGFDGARVLQQDSSGVRAVLQRAGRGYIVFNTKLNSYGWQLEGNTRDYQRFWKQLLEAGARNAGEPLTAPAEPFPVAGEQVAIVHRPDTGTVVNTTFPWVQITAAWLSSPGWQPGGWYLFNPGEWKTARAVQTMEQSRVFLAQQTATGVNRLAPADMQDHRFLHRAWWLLLFFLPAIFLWMEKKLD